MNPSWQPQSEADTDPSKAVVACAGHALQRLLPATSWYSPTGKRLQAMLPVLFCWLPAGHGRQKSDAPDSWKCPLSHSWQMKVEPVGEQQFGRRNIHQGSHFHKPQGPGNKPFDLESNSRHVFSGSERTPFQKLARLQEKKCGLWICGCSQAYIIFEWRREVA